MKFKFSLISIILITQTMHALEVPALTGRINDRANILAPSAENEIQQYLSAIEQKSGTQIVLLTIPSLEGESLEGFSIRVVEKWALGQKGKDNGVLLLIAMAEKKIRIEVGYGLEGVLTDAVSSTIIRNIIVPYFKKGQYANGTAAGLKAIGGVTSGEVTLKQVQSTGGRTRGLSSSLFPLIFILAFLLSGMGGVRRGRRRGMSFLPALFWGMFLSQGMRGSSRSTGSFGGGFGGGFSGGGGGFGGGGASGGW